jgi:hypothetical protein
MGLPIDQKLGDPMHFAFFADELCALPAIGDLR